MICNSSEYPVCIRCITYNHAPYIQNALNGFILQKTDFSYVCIIVDDASTDGEPDIIRQYISDHFDLEDHSVVQIEETGDYNLTFARHKNNPNCYFAVFLLKYNHHGKTPKDPYFSRWIEKAKYIAMCEGDDYWTDPLKLQKQVDYLDSHPDCTLSVHSADWLTDDGLFPGGCQDSFPKNYSVEELIRCGGYHFATASFVFRSELGYNWPEWRKKARVGDFSLQILLGLHGNVHYLPDRMCVYRYQHIGSWSYYQLERDKNIAFQKNKIEWMTLLDEATNHKYQEAIYDQLFQHYNSLFNLHEIGFWDYAKAVRKSGQKRYARLMKDAFRIYLSPFYIFLKGLNKK